MMDDQIVPMETVVLNLKYVQAQLQDQIRAVGDARDQAQLESKRADKVLRELVEQYDLLVKTEDTINRVVQSYGQNVAR